MTLHIIFLSEIYVSHDLKTVYNLDCSLATNGKSYISDVARELLGYYHAGGMDTAEEEEMALMLRDQEAFGKEVSSSNTVMINQNS